MSALLLTGAIMLGVIVGPALFRSLQPTDQERLVRRLPFLAALRPTTAPFSGAVPVLETPAGDALALLNTATPFVPPATLGATQAAVPTQITAPALALETPGARIVATQTALAAAIQAAWTLPATLPVTLPPTLLPTLPSTLPTTIRPASTATARPVQPSQPTLQPTSPPAIAQAATLAPTATPDAAALPILEPTPTIPPLPGRYRLGGALSWEPQRWNNCGPANLVQVMRFLGWQAPQADVAGAIKPTSNDKNVSPWELTRYVNTQTNLRAVNRVAGHMDMVRQLVASNFAVILETGFYDPDEPDEGWIGHYQTVFGYDDATRTLMVLDTLRDETVVAYDQMDELWRHFNRDYIVIYPPERENEVAQILGPNWDQNYNAHLALQVAIAEAAARPTDFFAWFNLGTNYTLLRQYQDAALAFDQAFNLAGDQLPHRVLWYQFGPYEAYYNTGRYDQLLNLIAYSLDTSKGDVEELFYWRGMVAAARGDMAAALADFDRTLAYNQFFTPAAVSRAQVQDGSFRVPQVVS